MALVDYSVRKRVAYITLNRPEKRNALSYELVSDLIEAFDRAEKDDSAKLVILEAKGEVFSAGADLDYLRKLQSNSFDENLQDSRHLKSLFEKIYRLDKIVIAKVQGHAIAGGCGLVSVCDLAYAAGEANFGYTEVKIGFIPAIVLFFLYRKVGETKAKELLLRAHLIDAKEAVGIGLIQKCFAAAQLDAEVDKIAEKMCLECSGNSLKITKKMFAEMSYSDMDDALDYAARMNAEARASEDCKRGIAAFLNKEKINW